MSWTTIAWSMMASGGLTLGLISLVIWAKHRANVAQLAFATLAIAASGMAGCEMLMMHAQTAAEFAAAQRWLHVFAFVGVVSITWFVRTSLGAGRLWLAYTVCALRLVSLIANFSTGVSLNYLEITGLRHVELWGRESVTVAEGLFNPWTRVGQLSLLLLVAYVVDASLAVWRRGDRDARRRAAVVGCSIAAFVLVATGHWALVIEGVIVSPFIVTPAFLAVVIAMGYELGLDMFRGDQLGRRLRISDTRLHNSEQRMDLAARSAGLALWEWDITRNEVWINERGRELFGFAPDERINIDSFMEHVHADDRDRTRETLGESLRGGGTEAEFRIAASDGGVRWVSGRGRVELDSAGKPALMRGVSIDITARKRAELQMEQDRIALRHMSRVSTLGQLSASIAHELNQPLAAILGNAEAAREMLAREPVDLAELREICDDIVNEDNRAAEVIRRLRELFRRGEVKREAIDVNTLVRETLDLLSNELLTRHVTADTDFASPLPPVSGDRVQLQQVLLNLVLNAADAMNGQATDKIVTIRSEATGAGIRLSVVDRGPGIAAEDMKNIFDPFWSTKHTGMGIGLAICQTIVDAHDGSITAVNNPDRGAMFCVTLPELEQA